MQWLGIAISPTSVGEPECNGVIERFIRRLKEQCLYLRRFTALKEAGQIIGEFLARYHTERLGYRTPAQARADGWKATT